MSTLALIEVVDDRLTGTHDCFSRIGEAAAESARSKAVLREGLAENADAVVATLLAAGVEVTLPPKLTVLLVLEVVLMEAETSVLAGGSVLEIIIDTAGADWTP